MFRGYSVGAVDYLFKPFSPEVLKSKVAVFVELFEKREALKRQTAALQRAHDELEDACAASATRRAACRAPTAASKRRAARRRPSRPIG